MNNTYGTIRPALISNKDIEIFYYYRPTRGVESVSADRFLKLDTSNLTETVINETSEKIPGVYNLKLPLEKFGDAGIYTIYMRPKETEVQIVDIGVLSAYSDIKGVVFKVESIESELGKEDGSLVGYRMEYLDYDTKERQDYYRFITTNNKAQVDAQNIVSGTQSFVKYRYTSTGGFMFCTVTPSTAPGFKANSLPYIGKAGQYVKLINTKFDPILLEVEMVEHDAETITNMLEGNQLRNLDSGIITTYNKDNEIYHQTEYGTIKESYNGTNLYDYKVKKSNVDFSQDLDEILKNV